MLVLHCSCVTAVCVDADKACVVFLMALVLIDLVCITDLYVLLLVTVMWAWSCV